MLIKSERLNLDYAKSEVKELLSNSITLGSNHNEYLKEFFKRAYRPELLFAGDMLDNIKEHPMAIWKTM
ncbi:MAG: hypothetical protein LR001_01735 [Clostridiales bacterium]|nr:hypothetical protein [Clostridiales bacterium]